MKKELLSKENLQINSQKKQEKLNQNFQQEQIQDILFNREISWQEIIYDLINTEQLNPWDVDITILTEKYLEKISEIEEADFFVSSKVLLAASLLLRIKSEILLNKYIKRIDEILMDKKDSVEIIPSFERIELDEEIPELIPKSPLPRFKKVTLKELIESLNRAIKTENRRIKKEIINKNALRETEISLPKKRFSIKDRIKGIHNTLLDYFKKNDDKKVSFTKFFGNTKEEKINSFFPLLHLENNKQIWLEQQKHFDEIHIWLHKNYLKHNPNYFEDIKKELEQIPQIGEKEIKKRSKKGIKSIKSPKNL